MFNFIIALSVGGTCTLLLTWLLHWSWVGAGIIGTLATVGCMAALARYVHRRLEAILQKSQRYLQQNPPRIDLAIVTLQQAQSWYRYQFAVKSQINAQIGSLHFMQRDFGRARSYLSQSSLWLTHWLCVCMLAVCYYKKKQHALMDKTLQKLLRRGRHHALAFALYAYLLHHTHREPQALQVLADGIRAYPQDHTLRDLQEALQNGRKMKMRGFGELWYQLQLERPPAVTDTGRGRMMYGGASR